MRNLSKTAWIVLGAGIFVIAFAALYLLYYQQGREQGGLENSLAQAQTNIVKVSAEKADWQSQLSQLEGELAQLNTRLAEAKAQLVSGKGALPSSVQSIEYDETLFALAEGWGLEMATLGASAPDREDIEGIIFTTTGFTVNVKGQVDDILAFIGDIIGHQDFASAAVESVSITVPPAVEGEYPVPSASIKLVVYGYQED